MVETSCQLEAGRKVLGLGYKTTEIGPVPGVTTLHHERMTITTGWQPACAHDAEPVSCTVLDPFVGSGTTLAVARRMGRRAVGIELQPSYLPLIQKRVSESALPLLELIES